MLQFHLWNILLVLILWSPFQLIEYLLETLSQFVYHLYWYLSSSGHSEATFFYNIMQCQWFFSSWTSWILSVTAEQSWWQYILWYPFFISGSSSDNSSFAVCFSQLLSFCHKNLGLWSHLLLEFSIAPFRPLHGSPAGFSLFGTQRYYCWASVFSLIYWTLWATKVLSLLTILVM